MKIERLSVEPIKRTHIISFPPRTVLVFIWSGVKSISKSIFVFRVPAGIQPEILKINELNQWIRAKIKFSITLREIFMFDIIPVT